LDDISVEIFGQRATGLPSGQRAARLSEVIGRELSPAKSPWTGKDDELISFSCACCSDGAEMRHSVGVFEASVPSYALGRRICWRCVHTDRYMEGQQVFEIDASDKILIEEIKRTEIPG
jgi:hypothetical protein